MRLAQQQDVQRSVLFSAADRQMEKLITQRDFERDLLLAVLFQPRVLVPDIFLAQKSPRATWTTEMPARTQTAAD